MTKVRANVSEATKLELQRRSTELGLTESGYIDILIRVSLYGFDAVIEDERKKLQACQLHRPT
jgi:hypothetical protein